MFIMNRYLLGILRELSESGHPPSREEIIQLIDYMIEILALKEGMETEDLQKRAAALQRAHTLGQALEETLQSIGQKSGLDVAQMQDITDSSLDGYDLIEAVREKLIQLQHPIRHHKIHKELIR